MRFILTPELLVLFFLSCRKLLLAQVYASRLSCRNLSGEPSRRSKVPRTKAEGSAGRYSESLSRSMPPRPRVMSYLWLLDQICAYVRLADLFWLLVSASGWR